MTERRKISFESGGARCVGYLHLPENLAEKVPCVVLCHGFSGTMDRLYPHAERFAAAGLAALVFDYRNFGESGGQPRQFVDVSGQQDDLRGAIGFARSAQEIDADRILLWGNSLGGGHTSSPWRPTIRASPPWSRKSPSTDSRRCATGPPPRRASCRP
ncbi:alpha/beta hydrolase [Nonomuraea dietziae]|uniref:alpha/beta hydrolase n=1 Tax=Nonomuraea dietziae TaxID=65515 RepID=UPI0033CF7057